MSLLKKNSGLDLPNVPELKTGKEQRWKECEGNYLFILAPS